MLLLVDGTDRIEGMADAAGVGKRGGIDGGEDGEGSCRRCSPQTAIAPTVCKGAFSHYKDSDLLHNISFMQ